MGAAVQIGPMTARPQVARAVSLQRDFQSRRFIAAASEQGLLSLFFAPRRNEFRLQAEEPAPPLNGQHY